MAYKENGCYVSLKFQSDEGNLCLSYATTSSMDIAVSLAIPEWLEREFLTTSSIL
jgi:hypothetical protein